MRNEIFSLARRENEVSTKCSGAALAAAEAELTLAQNCPDKRGMARTCATAMLELNLSRGAVRAALESQFGKVQAKRGPKPGSTYSEGNPDKHLITANLPTVPVQESIYARISAAGAKGMTLAEVRAAFEDCSDIGVLGTLKNGVTTGKLTTTGVTRGTHYHAATVAPASDAPVEPPSAE